MAAIALEVAPNRRRFNSILRSEGFAVDSEHPALSSLQKVAAKYYKGLYFDNADEDRFTCMETVEELRLTELQDSVSKIEEELDEGVVFLLIDQDDNALLLLSANAYYGVAFV